ncbi:MAG: hypothetical protein IPJ10_04710 [Flavobacteriales bacterium]|nr:hypothetical protein [Flavobacteriales bacterium]
MFASNTTRTIPDDALILSYRNGKVELRFRSVRRAWGTEVSIYSGDPKVKADWSQPGKRSRQREGHRSAPGTPTSGV